MAYLISSPGVREVTSQRAFAWEATKKKGRRRENPWLHRQPKLISLEGM